MSDGHPNKWYLVKMILKANLTELSFLVWQSECL
uniref:Uncharacterized protein n=1 Tax=Rhizophora mucronata TaxID=61149 RepID=A0A2P2N6S3_RHIMU